MMIRSLRLGNFKGIRRADIGFERLTVVVGPNASGKSSLLEALHLLTSINIHDPGPLFLGRNDPVQLYRRDAEDEVMELSCSGTAVSLRICAYPPANLPKNRTSVASMKEPWHFKFEYQGPDEGHEVWHPIDEELPLTWSLGSSRLLRLDASRMAEHSPLVRRRMQDDGQGLASALALMALNRPDDFALVQKRLRTVVAGVERIRFDRRYIVEEVEGKRRSLHEFAREDDEGSHSKLVEFLILDMKHAPGIFAYQSSEGTLLVLGLLTILMDRDRPDLILLDDIDRGLHPKAQRDVVGLLRTILD